jgi:uncharacterized SAM-binding protein YcdF (DUF218 family)
MSLSRLEKAVRRASAGPQGSIARPPRDWRRPLWWLLALSSLFAAVYIFRAPLLTGLVEAWIVDQPLQKADAIVVLGGGTDYRPFAAARLYREGWAPKILVMKTRVSPAAELGLVAPEAEIVRQILLKEGVAATDIVVTSDEVTGTFEESTATRKWATSTASKTIIIPTDVFHTRRVSWVFRKQFEGEGVQLIVRAVPVRDYQPQDWWRHEQGLITFQNEVLKFVYYWAKYRWRTCARENGAS